MSLVPAQILSRKCHLLLTSAVYIQMQFKLHVITITLKKVSEYDKEIAQSHTADQPGPRYREEEPQTLTVKRHQVSRLFNFFHAQLSTKYILPINVKIPTLVTRINTTSGSLKAREISVFQHFSFYELLKFYVQLS